MNIARPTVAEERWLALADAHPALRGAVEAHGGAGGWRTTTRLARVLGFLLGLFATSLLAGALMAVPSPLLVGGLAWVIAAEWLVARRRVFHSGIEEALYLLGAAALGVQLLVWSEPRSEALAVLLMSLAVLLVGWRLLNPLFTTLAAVGLSVVVALVGRRFLGPDINFAEAAVFCCVLAVAALVAGGRAWQRPAHDRMLDGLVILMPWVAHGWVIQARGAAVSAHAIALCLALAFLGLHMSTGLRRRRHAPLIAAAGNLACAGWALHGLLDWPVHIELMVAGALLLGVAMVIDRLLRGRESGISSGPDEDAALELAQLAGAAGLGHAAAPAGTSAPAGYAGQGGEFGGGGASGRF